jgi:hypothetical protein
VACCREFTGQPSPAAASVVGDDGTEQGEHCSSADAIVAVDLNRAGRCVAMALDYDAFGIDDGLVADEDILVVPGTCGQCSHGR